MEGMVAQASDSKELFDPAVYFIVCVNMPELLWKHGPGYRKTRNQVSPGHSFLTRDDQRGSPAFAPSLNIKNVAGMGVRWAASDSDGQWKTQLFEFIFDSDGAFFIGLCDSSYNNSYVEGQIQVGLIKY
jgi:hypothetical protein